MEFNFIVSDIASSLGYQYQLCESMLIDFTAPTNDYFTGCTYYVSTYSVVQYCYICFDGNIVDNIVINSATCNILSWNGSEYIPFREQSTAPSVFYDSIRDITYIRCPTSGGTFWVGGVNSPVGNVSISALDGDDSTITTAAREYFDTPTSPYMDANVYTKGNAGNKMISFEWDNLQNIPAGMYEASYQVRIGYAAAIWDNLVVLPYKAKFYQIAYQEYLSYLPDAAQEQAILDGRVYVTLELFHQDGAEAVVDWGFASWVYGDGSMDIIPDPGGSGTVTPHEDENPKSSDTYNDATGSIAPQAPGQQMSIDNLLTRSYVLTEQELKDFGDYCWNNDLSLNLFSNQVAPLENILSCKRIPFDVSGADATVWLGNLNTGVTGFLANSSHIQVIGVKQIRVFNNNWLDFLTNVNIYLPYCGIQQIPTSLCYRQVKTAEGIPRLAGRYLQVKYIYDIIYGTCAAILSMADDTSGNWNEFAVYNGSCGVDIPITASNRASNELSIIHQGANAATGAIANAIGGNLIGGLIGGLKGAADTATSAALQERHYTTAGGFSSQVASYLSSSVTLFYEHVLYTEPTEYAHENGYPCNLALNMSDLSGYTELDGSIEIDGIPCLDEERDLLKQALQDGFYL